jgi:ornithine carbamoyltransferase
MIDLAIDLKKAKYGGYERKHLTGKNIALIFEKTSTRTRCAFEVAAFDQGAQVSYRPERFPDRSQGVHEGHRPGAGRMTASNTAATARRSWKSWGPRRCAVWNGLTNEFHPTRIWTS